MLVAPSVCEQTQIKLQYYLPEYKYSTEQCPKNAVFKFIDDMEAAKVIAKAESERVALEEEERQAVNAEMVSMQPFMEKTEAIMPKLLEAVQEDVVQYLKIIHHDHKPGLEEFIVGGSFASLKIVDACITKICCDDEGWEMSELTANDIDVYFGSFTCDPGTSMCVNMHRIEYKKVDNLPWEINTVQCENLNAENFLQNNDLNITASCFHVDFSCDNLFSIHALPCF